MKNYLIKFVVLLVFVVSIATPTFAQTQTIQTITFTGRVLKVDSGMITIQTEKGVQQIILPQNISVTRNGLAADDSAIKPNDKVSIITDQNNQALKADVTSATLLNGAAWLIPLLFGLILLGIGVWVLRNKVTKSYFKTTSVNSQPTFHDISKKEREDFQ